MYIGDSAQKFLNNDILIKTSGAMVLKHITYRVGTTFSPSLIPSSDRSTLSTILLE